MSDSPVVEAWNLGLAYRVAHHRATTVKEYLVQIMQRHVEYERKWGIRHLSFDLRHGETLGVIGPNGAGKSTLMKVIARVLAPTEGRVLVRGRVAPLIELGAGFTPDLTGKENIMLYGMILGHEPAVMRSMVGDIAEYAGLVDDLDVPVRTYSSGMTARLAFAVATARRPDLLVVDEVFSVGDETFRDQSRRRVLRLVAEGAAVLLVSHELRLIRSQCDRVLWLDHGGLVMLGETEEVVDAYVERASEATVSE